MPKRKLEEELEADWNESKTKPKTDVIKKNSLDSDEEDDETGKNYDVLDEDEIEGQEEGTAGIDGEVHITPFNMKEELEEGHFDTEGNYHWNKEKLVRDNWLENIDWVKIKKPADGKPVEEESDSDDSVIASPFDHVPIYKQILDMMKPGETVTRALLRLGGNKTMTASERWKRKKAGEDVDNSASQKQVTELTEYANKLLSQTGNMDIYQETFEDITSTILRAEKNSVKNLLSKTNPTDPDELDMYADDFDEKLKAKAEGEPAAKKVKFELGEGSKATEKMETEETNTSKELKWEFKWDKKSDEIHGPHTSAEMQSWVDEGYFKKEVWVRKAGQDGEFYTSQRIDFELYM